MPKRPLHHVLYTNARGFDGGGYREIVLGDRWPDADHGRLGGWLRSLRPTEADGFAAAGFRLGGVFHLAIARCRDAFGEDEHGRGAHLAHAAVVPLPEGEPPGAVGSALVAVHQGLGANDLALLRERCRRELALGPVPGPKALGDGFADAVLTGALNGRDVAVGTDAIFDVARVVRRMAALVDLLPPRLRLACRWRVGLAAEGGGFRIRTGESAAQPSDAAVRLRKGLEKLRRDGTLGELGGNWQIRSWEQLRGLLS